ncbi:hypothetical protein ACFW93_28130 [Streptomyces canus]|uniref:hypothetical protein n=1 Tax=Streptomyces canus TaxID=58343 RepID=UPI0036AC4F20
MFEHRTEAEMRLYSEKLARELALKRRQKEGVVKNDPTDSDETPAITETTGTTDPE